MNDRERQLLGVCLSDQLFCAMYGALDYMHRHHHEPQPVEAWLAALAAMREISDAPRSDLMADMALGQGQSVSVLGIMLYMLMTQDMSHAAEPSDLKDVLCKKLSEQTLWPEFYEQVRLSEGKEEQKSRFVKEKDYSRQSLISVTDGRTDTELAKELVTTTLSLNDSDYCRKLELVLSRISDQHDGIYAKEVEMLRGASDEAAGEQTEVLKGMAGDLKANNSKHGGTIVQGDLVMEKNVEYEVGHVAAGGTGISVGKDNEKR